MDTKARKAIEKALNAAETVYAPHTRTRAQAARDADNDAYESASWDDTLKAMEALKRAVTAARKAIAESQS